MLVFVYGTLLSGLCNHHWLSGASFVGEDVTRERFRMVDLGSYPGVLDEPVSAIVGEVWSVDEVGLAKLDELEDYPRLYTRRVVELRSGAEAWMYLLRVAPAERGVPAISAVPAVPAVEVASGDYRAWLLAHHDGAEDAAEAPHDAEDVGR